uniref:Palmitoyltransferase n=1 Tax=Arcella intermedia TaxID=1963864 RepID=A0A6B2L1J4_9EUKA
MYSSECGEMREGGGFLDCVEDCVDFVRRGGDVNAVDENGETQVHLAVKRRKLDVLQWLVNHNGDLSVTTKQRGSSVLHLCVETGDVDMMKYLLAQGVDPNGADFKGRTPLHRAARYGKVLPLLLLLKLDEILINRADEDGRNVVHWAVMNKHTESSIGIVKYLLKTNVDYLKTDVAGDTPLHYTCLSGHPAFYLLIKKAHPIINLQNGQGNTPMDLCSNHSFQNEIKHIQIETRFYPFGLYQYKMELATAFWYFSLFASFGYLPIYFTIPFLVFIWFILSYRSSALPRIYVVIWHTTNLFIFLNMVLFVIPESNHWELCVAYLFCHVVSYYFYYLTAMTSPGIVTYMVPNIIEIYNYITSKKDVKYLLNNYCLTCMVKKVPRSKHCVNCDKCVLKFDHHCAWIDSCIGMKNNRYFTSYIWILGIGQYFTIYLYYSYLAMNGKAAGWWGFMQESYQESPITLLIMILLVAFVPLISSVMFFQIFLLYLGVSANEWANRHRYEYLKDHHQKFSNPYSLGFIGNARELCRPHFQQEGVQVV